MRRLMVILALAVISCGLADADTSLKPYSPFDEPKPRIPKEIMEDSRLDMKVNVFVKSKNLRDLFAEMSKQTGVKLATSRDISAERAIIYFHARLLRDVMTELSGLFGYFWLVKGKPSAYTYELFEDSRHAAHRDQLRQAQKDAQDELLLKLLEASAKGLDDQALKQIAKDDPTMYKYMAGDQGKQFPLMLSNLGEDSLRRILKDGRTDMSFRDLPPESQAIFLDYKNAVKKAMWDSSHQEGEPAFQPLTLEDMAKATVQFNRIPTGMFGMPRLELYISTDRETTGGQWPYYGLNEEAIRTLTNQEQPNKLIGEKLPEEPAITVPAKRKPALILGDVLQGMAEQSGKDVIADYYFQQMYPQPANKEALSKLAKRLCDELDYSCRVDGSMLEFRFNKWFVQPLPEEPPAKLVEAWWNKIETVGGLELDDLLNFAGLPERQMLWVGLRFMPGLSSARKSPTTLRLWNSLRPELEAIARSEEGLPIGQLNQDQLNQLYTWAKLMQVSPDADWSKAVIKITGRRINAKFTGPGNVESWGQIADETFALDLGDNRLSKVTITLPTILSETDRKELTAQRKADAEADKVEVVN